MYRVLITCPPMLSAMDRFLPECRAVGLEPHCPPVSQTLSEEELIQLVPDFDAWIIGDDPATERVLTSGAAKRLKAAVKWGIGIDNVDTNACKALRIPFANTPHMFASEVADVALGYVIGLARETFFIDREVRQEKWPKPRGISLDGKTVGLIGYGDIGSATAARLIACGTTLIVYDPAKTAEDLEPECVLHNWPDRVGECHFLVFTCALTDKNRHMLDETVFENCRDGVRIVNVARGPLIDESALITALKSGKVHSAALDVFECEPLPPHSALREFPLCVFGSHNASNTEEGVIRASKRAIELVREFLEAR